MSRVSSAVYYLLGIGIGTMVLCYGIHLIREARESRTWPTTRATITKSSTGLSLTQGKRRFFQSNIIYTFTVDGRDYQANKLRFCDALGRHSDAMGDKFKYPLGKTVIVFYQPDDPANCVLEPGDNMELYFIPGIGLFMIGLGVVKMYRSIGGIRL